MELSETEWAIICTIKQQPDYVFVYGEGRAAKKMAQHGFLKPLTAKMYAVTKQGEDAYSGVS